MQYSNLKQYIPDTVYTQIPGVVDKFSINTPLRLAHFLSQCAHESGNFRLTVENLNYGTKGLLKVFKRYFPTEEKAKLYERRPEKIANLVYGNRMGNGPESSGEGWRYRGRGYIQLTGKNNYRAFDAVVSENILQAPNLIATKYPLLSAAWYWNSRKINSVADQGGTEEVIIKVTKLVNGGVMGLEERKKYFRQYYKILLP